MLKSKATGGEKNAKPSSSVLSWRARGREGVKSHVTAGGIVSPGLLKKKAYVEKKKTEERTKKSESI